ncbi:MAG: hypothetical protein BAA01_00585 [Bacillus thermozeamaize]|uniref:Uncharacterized protein n=1 Tax=Bacillus thermozeamaize TaxID=230954 RepID=A0A1Y3PJQ3_9BACI|nr:MAG: hypothetical protein BAA01_00585 [Bacillus thermozeamaize]
MKEQWKLYNWQIQGKENRPFNSSKRWLESCFQATRMNKLHKFLARQRLDIIMNKRRRGVIAASSFSFERWYTGIEERNGKYSLRG